MRKETALVAGRRTEAIEVAFGLNAVQGLKAGSGVVAVIEGGQVDGSGSEGRGDEIEDDLAVELEGVNRGPAGDFDVGAKAEDGLVVAQDEVLIGVGVPLGND